MDRKKHLYNARFGRVRWFVHRFGARELVLKPLRTVLAPIIISRLPKKSFLFEGRSLPYFYSAYNMTWASERCVEVPIARALMAEQSPEATLEVGNVLSHYGPVEHEVLDKFERGERVINQDVTEYKPGRRYELIVSISTFEHIGYDDAAEDSSTAKIRDAVSRCRGLLTPGGRLVITAPVGYNPELDELLRQNALQPDKETYLKKYGHLDWRECAKDEALRCRYKTPFPYANAIVVARFKTAAAPAQPS